MRRKKVNYGDISTLLTALMPRMDNARKQQMLSLIFLVMATILEHMRSLLTVFIPRMEDATKRQMLSLFSLVTATMIMTTPLASAAPGLLFNKTASPAAYSSVGQSITYTYTLTNNGPEDLTGPVQVIDNKLGTFNLTDNGLNAGADAKIDKVHTITQDDINRTNITNSAYAVGNSNGVPYSSNSRGITVEYAHLTLEKTANLTNYSRSGQVIEYNYTVRNDGHVNLTGPINITDDHINGGLPFSIKADGLNVGESNTSKSTYNITSVDTNVSSVTNSAFATGIYKGINITSSNKAVTVPYAPLTLEKTATPTAYSAAGQNITYTYKVTNVGDYNISGLINITDDHINGGLPFNIKADGLNLSENKNKTVNYTIQPSDITTGFVTNTAFATGTQNGSEVRSTNTTETVEYAHLTLEKTASPTSYWRDQQNISYNYSVRNDGHVNLTGPVNITDDHINGGLPFSIKADGLNVSESKTNTTNYTINSSDITTGVVTNKAFATGTYRNISINSSNKAVTILYSPLTLEKTPSPTAYSAAGQNITYTYKVTNDGDYNISGPITVTDNKLGPINITDNDLNVSKNISKTVNYTIQPSDINTGSVTNAAYAIGTYNNNYSRSGTTTATAYYAHLTLEKTASPTNYSLPGQNITYTYKVTNDGVVNLQGPINVTDNKLGTFSIKADGLNVSESKTNISTYPITSNDINASYVTNSAFATGTYSNISINSSSTTATAHYAPLKIEKIASPTAYSVVGQNITYTYKVTNVGDKNITSPINVTDDHINGNILISQNGLNVSANTSKTAIYAINQTDIDRGYVTNSAIAKSTYNGSEINSTATATALYAHLTLEKTPSPTNYSVVGQNITYTYKVTNDGKVNLTGPIKVTDNRTGTFNITDFDLNFGQNVSKDVSYPITSNDINASSVTNSATATGTYNGVDINSTATTATVRYTVPLKLVKTASPTTYGGVGQNVTYNYNVTNVGNVNLTGPITVTDDHINGGIPFNVTASGLGAGASVNGTAIYTIKPSDINAGFVTNNATATGIYNGSNINSNATTATVLYAHLKLVKTASPIAYGGVGQNVTYNYNVTNDGNVTLTGPIKVTDDHINGGIPFNVTTNGLGVLASVNGTVIYTIKPSDINAGFVTNNATATGIYNGYNINSNATTATVRYAHLKLVKTASPIAYGAVGQNVTYNYNVTNDGNVTLTGPIKVTDDHINGGIPFNVTASGLGVLASVNGTVIYTIKQSDINAGFVTNNATATGIYNGYNINSNATTATVRYAHLKIVKTASPTTYSYVGQNVTYNYNLTNDGNVTLTGPLTVTDDHINGGIPFNVTANGLGVLASVNGTAIYTIRQSDINAGSVTNNATATGIYNGIPVNSNSTTATIRATGGQGPVLTITKSADPETYERVGQEITYAYVVTNVGNASITGPITVTDDHINGGIPFNVTPNGLGVGANVNGTAIYTITRDDINADSVTNNAIATGIFNNTPVNSDSVAKTIMSERDHNPDYNPDYSIIKSVIGPDDTGDCIVNSPGDTIPYRIMVTNEGNVDLTNVEVTDSLVRLPEPTGDDNNDGVLNVGETWRYDVVYTLTADDVDNGNVNNIATVICDQREEKSSSVDTPVVLNADLSIYKSAIGIDEGGNQKIDNAGDIINYQVAVKNNGDVDLTGISVDDPMVTLTKSDGDHNDPGILNPGETWVYTGDYAVTQEDINSVDGNGFGYITNTATVDCNEHLSESSSYVLPFVIVIKSPDTNVIPVADFSASVKSGNAPLSVQFTDKSTGSPTSWSWDFNNDGVADSSVANPPAYTYTTTGTYVAKLTVSNANGSSSPKTDTITVLQATSSTPSSTPTPTSTGGGGGHSSGGSSGTATVVSSGSPTTSAITNVTQPENNNQGLDQNKENTPAKVVQTPTPKATSTPANKSTKTPGFETMFGITALLGAVFLCRRR